MIKTIVEKWDTVLRLRWDVLSEDVLRPLRVLYGERDDFEVWVARFLEIVGASYRKRSEVLRELDQKRVLDFGWYKSAENIGYICYTDQFANTLKGLHKKLPYLKDLGITYLHLMPLLEPRPGANDGGYAVANYRQVDARLGTMDDLAELATTLREQGISLCTDLVCNHSAIEHEWAQKALAGDPTYQDYYLMFPDRTLPDQYDQTLREIFPDEKRGNFVYHEAIERWVWTTFYTYQWDLNYRNPAVFGEMLAIMLYLANQGVEILRMDAVAFMWKELGTESENRPEAHALLQAWRALTQLAAPALILKAEAIVSPELVVPYFGVGEATNKECELAYNNSLMVLLWSALAERNVNLLTHSLQQLPPLPSQAAWVTYVRCHDDIGWAITDENAEAVGKNGGEHRAFLSDFYSGIFHGSFARGSVFQFNPDNLDRRINGMAASLAGLELALEQQDAESVQFAVKRILLLYNMIFAYGGIPLIYMGDELGQLNHYGYLQDEHKRDDGRWIQRPKIDWKRGQSRHKNQIFIGLQRIIATRKQLSVFHADTPSKPIFTGCERVFGLLREGPRGKVLVLGNFSEAWGEVSAEKIKSLGFSHTLTDQLTKKTFPANQSIRLRPFEALWLLEMYQ